MTKPTKWHVAESDQSLRCPHEEALGPWLSLESIAKTDQTGRMLGAQVILLVLSCSGSMTVYIVDHAG